MVKLWIDKETFVSTDKGIDISLPLKTGSENVLAWYCEPIRIEPVVIGDFVGDVKKGGPVNFKNIHLNPHGNGTHTECVGHISSEDFTINQCLREFHFRALLVTVQPDKVGENEEITESSLGHALNSASGEKALIIRTIPNGGAKRIRNFSGTNPPYMSVGAMDKILTAGFDHLIIDLPSVDRERDGGKLAAHHRFWNYPEQPRIHRTITELVYVPDEVSDGPYFLTFQICSLESDASPSKVVLYSYETQS